MNSLLEIHCGFDQMGQYGVLSLNFDVAKGLLDC